jgi:hypothetical protein
MAESRHESADAEAHDVLAAEAFAVPAPDPQLRHDPVVLPEDPTGIPEPHDILAAEEFPMPSARPHAGGGPGEGSAAGRLGIVALAAGLLAWAFRRRGRS